MDKEELGGWKLHTGTSGLADLAVDSDEEAIDAVKRFLSYLSSHHMEAPPVHAVGSDDAAEGLLDIVPADRAAVYDMTRVIAAVADRDSVFELKGRYGRSMATALARLDGRSVGILGNNPRHKGGAVDAEGCNKAIAFLVLCDSFNIPIVMLVDVPGFLVGIEGERKDLPGRISNWMNALSLCTVPKISVILRKSYGQAYLDMGGGPDDDPDEFARRVEELTRDSAAWEPGRGLRGAGRHPLAPHPCLADPHARGPSPAPERRRWRAPDARLADEPRLSRSRQRRRGGTEATAERRHG